MSQRVRFRFFPVPSLRTRTAVMAVGMGVTVVAGAGIAAAADSTAVGGETVKAVWAQVEAQTEAAKKARVEAAKKARVESAKKAFWVDPVRKYEISASYAQAGGMWRSAHSGQDYAVPNGTKVMAVHGGTVVKVGGDGAGDGPAYGNAVVIKHGKGTYSQYAHLSEVDVRPGQTVSTGQKIAASGDTGNSSGPHLHLEIRTGPDYGSAIDPVKFLRGKGVRF